MTLLNTAAGVGNTNQDTTEAENIYAANAALAKPKKVSSRPVEPVPVKFDEDEANKMLSYAKSNAATGSVSSNSLVQNQLNNVLATDGPLLKRARTDGFASAAERGLNNSSMGVQAGEEAVIRQALQIATPDAQTYGEMDRANLSSAANMAQTGVQQAFADYNQKKQNAFTTAENNIDRNQKDDLFDRGNEFTASQQDKQNQFSSGENKAERDFRTAEQDKLNTFNVQRDAMTQGYNLDSIKAQTAGQIEVAASQLDEKSKGAYLDAASSLQRSYIDQQTAILNNPALKKDIQVTNALNVAKQNFESSVSYLQGLYSQGGVTVDTSAFPAVGPVQSTPPPSAAVMPAVQAQLSPRQAVMAGRT